MKEWGEMPQVKTFAISKSNYDRYNNFKLYTDL